MSHIGSSTARPEFDFWEFVACARCHMPFVTDDGAPPQVPFWITECGHIVCNNHLNSDQSCVECGSHSIQVAPLQRKMEPPMSDWFRPATQTIESLAFSTRFQIETLASLVRYYKKKCHQQRALIERAKTDSQQHKLLKQKYGELKAHSQQMTDYINRGRSQGEPSEAVNNNGKRPMFDAHRSVHSNSSPRSIVTPVGPDRLTLQQPPFTPRLNRQVDDAPLRVFTNRTVASGERPGSSRFAEQFAYDPPQPEVRPSAALSHSQDAALQQAQAQPKSSSRPFVHQSHEHPERTRPSSTSRDHGHQSSLLLQQPSSRPRPDQPPPSTTSSQLQMPPPPIPQSSSSRRTSGSFRPAGNALLRETHSLPLRPSDSSESLQSNRFLPPSRVSTAQQSATQLPTQRFIPSILSLSSRTFNVPASGSRRDSGSGLQASLHNLKRDNGGQRMPFVPSSN